MVKYYLFIIIFFVCNKLLSQDWQEKYNTFITEFQNQNYDKAIITGKELLNENKTQDSNYYNVLRYVAFSYYGTKDYANAVENYKLLQQISRNLYGTENYNYILVTYNLAINYTYIGKYSLSYPLIVEVISYIVKDQTKNSLDYINTANQLANIYNIAGSYSKAQETYEEVFNVVKNNYNESDSMYMATVNTIAPFYFSHGMYDKAEPFYTNAVELMEKLYGKLSENYLASYNSLGEFYLRASMYSKAESVYKDFVEICLQHYGKYSADYATALNNLAVCYEKLGKNDKAVELYKKCLIIKEKVYKKESDYYALTLSNFAVLYDNMGKYNEAENLLNEAIDIYKKVYGEKNANYATALNNLVSVYSASGKYNEAIKLSNKALDIQKELYGENYEGYINSLNNLAHLFEQTGNIDSAQNKFLKVIDLRKQLQGENHLDYSISLYNLANIYILKGNYANAEKMLNNCLVIQKKSVGVNHSSYANTLNSLAGLYSSIGNVELATNTYDTCKIIFEKIYGDMHPEYATFLNNLGLFYFQIGNYDESEEYLLKSLKIQENAFGKLHPDNVNMLENLANTYVKKGNYKNAENLLLQALNITKEKLGTNHQKYASLLLSLGVFYYETGNYNESEKKYNEALSLYKSFYGTNHSDYSTTLNNLGTLFLAKATNTSNIIESQKLTDKAFELFNQSIKIDSTIYSVNSDDYASHLNNLAELYRNVGQLPKAEQLYLKTIEIERNIFGENYPDLAVTYHNLALLYSADNNFEKAKSFCEKSLDLKQKSFGKNSPVCIGTLSSLAYIYEGKHNFKQAAIYYNKSLDISTNQLKNIFTYLSEEEKSKFIKSVTVYNDMFKSFVQKAKNEMPELTASLYNLELLNKGILLRTNETMRNEILNSNNSELINEYKKWIGNKQQLAKLYSTPISKRNYNVDSLENETNTLEKQIVANYSNNSNIFNNEVKFENIKSKLKPDEAAIEFTHFNTLDSLNVNKDIYCAFVITSYTNEPIFIKLFEVSQINDILSNNKKSDFEYVSELYNSEKDNGKTLYNLVWKPIDSLLKNIKSVYYSASGILNKISFSAIPVNANSFLSDKYEINSISSTSLIASHNAFINRENINNISIFGGANFNSKTNKNEVWKYLEGTKNEADNIESLFKENKLKAFKYEGLLASEENFKNLNGNNSTNIIHIATHGYFFPSPEETKKNNLAQSETGEVSFRGASDATLNNEFISSENPLMRSGLALARANDFYNNESDSAEDGVLTAYEVSNMNFTNTNLVVLSACETGLGDIKGSEGVYGLQRAFKLAGVKFIIMSLWQVPDKETEEFMIKFYTKLISNKSYRKSFLETQNEMRKKYSPYYWAAFVLVE